MKNVFAIFLLAIMLLLTACSNDTPSPEAPPTEHIHAFGEWETVNDASCTEEGLQERTCSCGETESQTIPATHHFEVTSDAVAATCTTGGMTESKYCTVCGTVTMESTAIPVLPHSFENGICSMCEYAPDILISRVWTDEPGPTMQIGDSITFFVEAYFKYQPGSFILWFKSSENPSSIKSAVSSVSATADDNIYAVTLSITDNMFPGKWVADWYYITDQYGTGKQESFSAEDQQDLWFTIAGDVEENENIPPVSITKVWMDEPGKTLHIGNSITFYVEAYFKYQPGSFILWFKSSENPSSIKSAVSSVSATADDNIYAVTLSITDNMFPGKWVADWYYINDQYGTGKQMSFTEEDLQNLWFVIE